MKHLVTTLTTAAATLLLASACSVTVDDPADPATSATELVQQDEVSECGGFAQAMDSSGAEYCDAEMLYWSYDATTEKLSLTNTRIELNCCGEHSMVIAETPGGYTVTETDAPEMIGPGEGARCSCMCVFDFALAAEGVSERTIQLNLDRNVTDQGPVERVLEATIDLSEGSGAIVVDDTETFWCDMEDSVS
ncbi:MAG: hypothetical protein JRI23_02390 [Deltaproteobacteria bacterium]|jgi:membrane-bound inhibitor of C-type lysozyme|nr:hypothetical protein [Deltaproteobacteria bacterium]MBW2530335.1 hypothetical protein [Deltaproteobacteria bacterium]